MAAMVITLRSGEQFIQTEFSLYVDMTDLELGMLLAKAANKVEAVLTHGRIVFDTETRVGVIDADDVEDEG